MKKINVLKISVIISRILFGAVFIFSGFVKIIDPLGYAYKIEEYLEAMGPFFAWFDWASLPASIALSIAELLIGICLLLNVRLREVSFLGLLFMLAMTPLTLWIMLSNPVTDCGCFGDALIISNSVTFWKNVVLLAMIVFVAIFQKHSISSFRNSSQWLVAAYTCVFSLGLALYCYFTLPIIDFRPYKIGKNIIEGMTIPPDAPINEYQTTFIYSKDGVEQEFTLENYPRNDDTWLFVDQKSVLVKKGYVPPIHDFTIDLPEMGEITDIVLEDARYTFLLISPDLTKANLCKINTVNRLYGYCKINDYSFYCLTASTRGDIEKFKANTNAEFPIALTDKTTLKTIIRSNPGLLLLKDATVLNKWHALNIPTFTKPLEGDSKGEIREVNTTMRVSLVALIFFVPIILLFGNDKQVKNVKRD